jgi:hypothetical protein
VTLPETLIAVWQQVLAEEEPVLRLEGESYRVGKTRSRRLRTVEFTYGPHSIVAIEQNPNTGSRWARLARQGKRVMQFSHQGRYIGNVVEGRLTRYPAWQALRLPE